MPDRSAQILEQDFRHVPCEALFADGPEDGDVFAIAGKRIRRQQPTPLAELVRHVEHAESGIVRRAEDVERYLDIPVIGSIPNQ